MATHQNEQEKEYIHKIGDLEINCIQSEIKCLQINSEDSEEDEVFESFSVEGWHVDIERLKTKYLYLKGVLKDFEIVLKKLGENNFFLDEEKYLSSINYDSMSSEDLKSVNNYLKNVIIKYRRISDPYIYAYIHDKIGRKKRRVGVTDIEE